MRTGDYTVSKYPARVSLTSRQIAYLLVTIWARRTRRLARPHTASTHATGTPCVSAPVRANAPPDLDAPGSFFESSGALTTGLLPSPESVDGDGAATPAHVTGIDKPSEASTTVAKSVATVTGTFTTSPAALPSQAPTTVTSTLACPAPSVVMIAAPSDAWASTRELSTSATACAPPALTCTFVVIEGPSEKDRPRSGIVAVEPSATGSAGKVRPIEDFAARGARPLAASAARRNHRRPTGRSRTQPCRSHQPSAAHR